jgi:hypothetical protein
MMAEPELSVILATDTYATIRPVIECVRRQTIRDRIELVLVAPSAGAVAPVQSHRDEFAAITVVEAPVQDMGKAKAAGVHAATAEFVFNGETHSYPHPGCLEALMRHRDGPWTIITPAFGNANPVSVWSWAGLFCDYGAWVEGRPAGEIFGITVHNAAFRREALLAMGDRLAPALSPSDELAPTLKAAGHRAYFEPAARLDHVNVASPWHWAKERFATGILIASSRARRWPFARRALYLAASPLIPLVLSLRVLPGTWSTVRSRRLPLATVFWTAVGMAVKAGGELLGYAGAAPDAWERRLHEYEVHKLAYAGPMAA